MDRSVVRLSLVSMFMVFASVAEAHHAMDGATPATFWQGLLSGLGHPIIGIDHFAAIFGVGALAAMQGASVRVVLAFVFAMLAGAAIHAGSVGIPASELFVALSLLAFAVVLFTRPSLPSAGIAALFAAGGFIHGYALGESIVGAEQGPLVAYFVGLAVIQSALAVLSFFVMKQLAALKLPVAATSVAGCIVGLVGLVALGSELAGRWTV